MFIFTRVVDVEQISYRLHFLNTRVRHLSHTFLTWLGECKIIDKTRGVEEMGINFSIVSKPFYCEVVQYIQVEIISNSVDRLKLMYF